MTQNPRIIAPADLIAMDTLAGATPLRVDLVYADSAHPENVFGCALYREDARLWLHRDMAGIVIRAAQLCFQRQGLVFVLKDGLRTVEAQIAMQNSPIAQRNPHWQTDPARPLSKPGTGGHPRGMAVDITLETSDGRIVNMGTPFDAFFTDLNHNPARRDYPDLSPEVQAHRSMLDTAMLDAAAELNLPLHLLSVEWWDFRFPSDYYNAFAPIHDVDLPEGMRMGVLV